MVSDETATPNESDVCPEHGEQGVVGYGEIGPAHDPYGTVRLWCGHEVACYGPGEPNVIVRPRRTVR